MPDLSLDRLENRTIFPGFDAKIIHTKNMSLAYVSVAAGAELPEHSHHNEQVVNVLSGDFELVVDGEPHRLERGVVFVSPPDVKHSGKGLTACEILDVFSPIREDWL